MKYLISVNHPASASEFHKIHFSIIAKFIIQEIRSKTNCEISLTDLLDEAKNKIGKNFRGNLLLYILTVKKELESHNIIKTTINKQKRQNIKLRRNYNKQLSIIMNDHDSTAQYFE